MFTGIVEEVGAVESAGGGRLTIGARGVISGLAPGGSMNVNGVCLTVTALGASSFSVDLVPETLRRTNLGALRAGDPVNLERPLAASGRLDGHIVQGHVDGTGTVSSIEPDGEALMVRVEAPSSIMRYVAAKGFVAVDGTSLTVVNCDDAGFSFTVIPYTGENTVLRTMEVRAAVNIEVDIFAKYVERLMSAHSSESSQ